MSEATYWNGEEAPCRRVRIVVGGTEQDAVEVDYHGDVFYLSDEAEPDFGWNAGHAWRKVTLGHGSPRYGHRNVTPDSSSLPGGTR